MKFEKATKEKAKLRNAIFGPSGSGKTYTSLAVATGLVSLSGGDIALIDTERGSASKYADRFEFDVLDLPKTDIDTYVQAIEAAQAADYEVLIIDSLTHAWQELLGEVDKLAQTKYRGNTWSAWSEGTPKQRQLIDAILNFDGHIIGTMRTKTEWVVETSSNGKMKPTRIGLAPMQGKGIEYEFDLLMELTPDHVASVLKDRTGKYQDKIIDKPGEKLGAELAEWLSEGVAPKPKPSGQPATKRETDDPNQEPEPSNGGKIGRLIARIKDLNAQLAEPDNIDPIWLDEATEQKLTAYGMTLRKRVDAEAEQEQVPDDMQGVE